MSAHNDSAFLRMFLMILGALVLFTVIILIAANRITGVVEEHRGEDPRLRAAIAERIKPVGSVNVASATPAAPATPKSGAEVVAAACNACHGAGVLGAPKIGDKAAWSQRLSAENGLDGLTAIAIKGKGAMPPKGGTMVSDGEIRAAIEYMLSESGVDAAADAAATTDAAVAPSTPVAAVVEAVKAPVAEAAAAVKDMAGSVADKAKSMAAAVMPAAASAPEAPAVDLAKGKTIYSTACFVCHVTGAAGAPKLDDKANWAPRLAQGLDTLANHAINGKGNMPPKGGRVDIADEDIRSAVAYMMDTAK